MNPNVPATRHWHILTGEYPPVPGGVSDYTHIVAGGLAGAGDRVTVWTTPADGPTPSIEGVRVERRGGLWSRGGLASLGRELDGEPAPRRLLVQYTPMSWGYRGVNLGLGPWLVRRRSAGDDIWAMMHEVQYDFRLRDKPTRWLIAAASVWNVRALLAACNRVFYSIPAWEPLLRRHDSQRDRPMRWQPVPSNVPVVHDPKTVSRLRREIAPGGEAIVGHFGTFGMYAGMLEEVLGRLLPNRSDRVGLLLGRGGERFAAAQPERGGRLIATSGLPPERLSLYIQACDVMIQPYVDGLSTRRGTLMAALAHGRPVVSAEGFLSEPIWSETEAVSLAGSNEPGALAEVAERLLSDPGARARVGEAARALYDSRFSVQCTVKALRRSSEWFEGARAVEAVEIAREEEVKS